MNHLYYGDNLDVLRRYIKDESVDLCYIDPPFNSKRNYNQIYNNVGQEDRAQAQAFVDTWTWDTMAEKGLDDILTNYNGRFTRQTISLVDGLTKVLGKGSLLAYLVSMTLRIVEIHRVLKETGSFYLHCDPTSGHYLKVLLDSVFLRQGGGYRNEIVWCYTGPGSPGMRQFMRKHDTIFWYSKSDTWQFNADEVRVPHSKKTQENYKEGLVGSGFVGADHFIHEKGKVPEDWWKVDVPEDWWEYAIAPRGKEYLGYPTQKPEKLLDRIIRASSKEGDVVLDAYCGCGTTVSVSQKLNRQWIGIDITYQSISLILKRLEDSYGTAVAQGVKLTGVPKDYQAAYALAHQKDDRTRKEFEKWAVLTFSQNRAIINEKKGRDNGIDGTAYIWDNYSSTNQELKPIIFSVKSSETLTPAVVRELYGTVEREKAAMGYLLTLNPMENLVRESKKYGFYTNELFGGTYPKIEVISVRDILNGERIRIPLNQKVDVVKAAQAKGSANQLGLF